MRFYLIFLLVLVSCSGVKPLTYKRKPVEKIDTSKLYEKSFLQQISSVKEKFKNGKTDIAIKELNQIKESGLNTAELATKKNLLGVISFSKKSFDDAEKYFSEALKQAEADPELESQIQLNLGSTYFKLNQFEKSLKILQELNYHQLPATEAKKYHHLFAVVSEQLGKKDQRIQALIRTFDDKKTLISAREDSKFTQVVELYMKLSETERIRLLENFEEDKNLVIPLLVEKEIELAISKNDLEQRNDLIEWLQKHYSENKEVEALFAKYSNQSGSTNMPTSFSTVGVVLPLTGDQKSLGERALQGIEFALFELEQKKNIKINLEVKDTQSSVASGAFSVKDLIENKKVNVVIGGLNPTSATKEYMEAKAKNILFISLSQVLVPTEEKNKLLIEIPGSIESQMEFLFSEKVISKLGKRPAIIYPKTELGETYVNEFWKRAQRKDLEVTGVVAIEKDIADFREPVKGLIGIKYPKEREEEAQVVNDISFLEKNKNVKRLQNLQPMIDFDWVFVPLLPRNAVQVLSGFNFFDAFNLNFIGVPSWRSELMINEGYRYGNVFFLDDKESEEESVVDQEFEKKYNRKPKLVELISYDALSVLSSFIGPMENQTTSRQTLSELKGLTGNWNLVDNIWIKNLSLQKIKREGVEPIQ